MNHDSMQTPRWLLCVTSLAMLLLLGCGPQYDYASTKSSIEPAMADSPDMMETAEMEMAGEEAAALVNLIPQGQANQVAVDNRKIIYNSTISLVVDDYARFESELPGLVAKHGGFVASSDTDRRYQDQQTGTWVVRIPVAQYTPFLSGITALGFAESRSENAQDVTEEYVDVEARIKNKRTLEQRIITMLEERSGKLSDVLEIERELSRVREEIERMEGRLRFLKDRTSLATVTINCREQKEYEPPEAPTFVSRASQSWSGSLHSLRFTAENLVIGLIAVAPWLVVLSIPVVVAWKLAKRWFRKRFGTSSPS